MYLQTYRCILMKETQDSQRHTGPERFIIPSEVNDTDLLRRVGKCSDQLDLSSKETTLSSPRFLESYLMDITAGKQCLLDMTFINARNHHQYYHPSSSQSSSRSKSSTPPYVLYVLLSTTFCFRILAQLEPTSFPYPPSNPLVPQAL